jgi:hypothetical protein
MRASFSLSPCSPWLLGLTTGRKVPVARRTRQPFSFESLSHPEDGRMRRGLHFAPGSRGAAPIGVVNVLRHDALKTQL